MKENLLSFKIVSVVVLAGVVLAFSNSAHAAPSFSRAFTLPGGNGRVTSSESVLHGTLVEQGGLTAISSIDRKWDAPSGTGTLNEAAVTPAGQVASRDANIVRNTDGTFTVRGTMTDFDGTTVNYTEVQQRAAGGFTARGTTTGLGGETSTYETKVALIGRNQIRRTTVTTKADGTTSTRVETITARQS